MNASFTLAALLACSATALPAAQRSQLWASTAKVDAAEPSAGLFVRRLSLWREIAPERGAGRERQDVRGERRRQADDTPAFLDALVQVKAARSRCRRTLQDHAIARNHSSQRRARGAGPDKTVLFFPIPLNEIKPNWGATTRQAHLKLFVVGRLRRHSRDFSIEEADKRGQRSQTR
jgi:hypothetical protein